MPALEKAKLLEVTAGDQPKPVPNTELAVQFNPQSLKLALASLVSDGDTRGQQNRQHMGNASTTLSFDLHFDTADQGTTEEPVSVRTQTAMVERFVLPGKDKQTPPKCRFQWNELVIDGIIDNLSIDFELFAANGTPLRAKMSVSIKEQDARYLLADPPKNAANATPPGKPGTGPGSKGGGPTDRSAQAHAGESAADFAVRMGLDPSAWRGIAGQLGAGSSLSLEAGLSIDFNASLSASGGIGISAGVDFGASLSLEASFGLEATASAGFSLDAGASAGFALSAAGGLGAALETVAIVQTASAAAAARRSFGPAIPSAPPRPPLVNVSGGATAVSSASIPAASAAALGTAPNVPQGIPPPGATLKPALPDQTRTPLQRSGLPMPAQQAAAPAAPPRPLADPRATSFGQGVPLRPRGGSAADLRADVAAGRAPLRPRAPVVDLFHSTDPSVPPWTRLPPDRGRNTGDRAQARRFPARPCHCGGKCK